MQQQSKFRRSVNQLTIRIQKILSLLKFWWSATNAHGVHSPFVYQLVTRCFYEKEYKISTEFLDPKQPHFKSAKLIYKILNYLKFDEILSTFSDDYNTHMALSSSGKETRKINTNNSIKISENSFIFIEQLNEDIAHGLVELLSKPPDNFVVLIRNIRHDKTTFKRWTTLQRNTAITISIDTYGHGFLFRRSGQVKEDFKIRL